MKIKLKQIIVPLVFGLLYQGCAQEDKKSDAVKTDEVYQHYSVRYEEDGKMTTATAEFRAGAKWDRTETEKTGGTAVVMVPPAEITFNGQSLWQKSNVFTGGYYEKRTKGDFDGNYTFMWKDNEGKTFTNTQKINSIGFKDLPSKIRTEDFTLTWSGTPVGEYETVTIWLKEGEKKISQSTGETGATSVVFTEEQLKNLEGMSATAEISRVRHVPLEQATPELGFFDLSYQGKNGYTRIVKRGIFF